MASNINTTSIDETYPVAGQDNNSQGFRDNFTTIKNNFVTAKTEIETLQTNTAKLNAANNFANNTITGAKLINNTTAFYGAGTITTPQNISIDNGNFQSFIVGANLTLTLTDWPTVSNAMSSVIVELRSDGVARTVVWSTENAGLIYKDSAFPTPFIVNVDEDPMYVEFWTYNQGATVFAKYLGTFSN
jgi:hypothetical protein